MKKIALCVLVGLATLGSAFANPIKGLVDVATGKEVPDADLRYMKIGVTNSSAVFSNLYVLASATGNYDVVNWFSMTNYIGTGALTNETLAVVTARGSNTPHNIFVRDMTVSGTVYCIDEAIVFRDATALNENIGMEIDIHPVNSQTASVWVGYGALAGASGRYNTGLGYKAGGSHTGSYNTAVGLCSLYMGYNGEKNTALGYCSGARSAGVSNVFMGYYAGYYASKTAVTNAIAIGAGVVPKGNNTAVWGRSDQTNYFDGMIVVSNDVLPFVSNTVDIGSQTMPFRSVNASNFNLVGSSISFNGVPYLLSSNGTLICTVPFYTVSGVTNGFDYVLVNDLIGNTLSVSNGAFTELTVSTAASSGIQAVNWETMTNYVGSHSSSLPSNLVFSISNNYYAVGTTQQMDRLVVSNLQVVAGGTVDFFGNIFTNAITNQVLYADGSQAWTGNQNAGGFGITNIGFLVPSGSNTVDLGSAALPFRDLYLGSNSIYMAGVKVLSYSNGNLVIEVPIYTLPNVTNDFDYLLVNDLTANMVTVSNGAFQELSVSSSLLPATSNTVDIGSAALPFRHGYFGESVYLGDYQVTKAKAQGWDTAITNNQLAASLGTLTITGGIVPNASNTLDIGSQTLPFRSMNASNFNVVGSSISFNGVPFLIVTNGQLVSLAPFVMDSFSLGGVTVTNIDTNAVADVEAALGVQSNQLVLLEGGTSKWNASITNNQPAATLGTLTVSGGIVPNASNTLDIGSQTLPFRSVNASNFNVVGSSISFNGVEAITKSNSYVKIVGDILGQNTPQMAGALYAGNYNGSTKSTCAGNYLNSQPNVTVSCWFKLTNSCDGGGIVSWSSGLTGYKGLIVSGSSVVFDNGDEQVTSANSYTQDVWCHVVGVLTNGDYGKIFLNGTKTTDIYTWPHYCSQSSPLYIGLNKTTAGGEQYFKGNVDEVACWTRALSDAEVADLYYLGTGRKVSPSITFPSTSVSMGQSLELLYHCDEGTGTNMVDSSGYSRNGIFGGYWTAGKTLLSDVLGYGGYASSQDMSDMDTRMDTVEGWGNHNVAGYLKANGSVALAGSLTPNASNAYAVGSDAMPLSSAHAGVVDADLSIYLDATELAQVLLLGAPSGRYICPSLCVHSNMIFATTPAGYSQNSFVFYSVDGTTWDSHGATELELWCLASYKNKLYIGAGSNGVGSVLSYDGTTWSTAFNPPSTAIRSLYVYDGILYAGGTASNYVYAFDGTSWTTNYTPDDWISAFSSYNGKLYAGGATTAKVYVYDGSSWELSYDSSEVGVLSAASYDGKLYVGTKSSGIVLMFDGTTWSTNYDSTASNVNALVVYNGKLYAGMEPTKGMSFDGTSWREVFTDAGTSYGYVSLAPFKGKLYVGNYSGASNGRVYRYGDTISLGVESTSSPVENQYHHWTEKNEFQKLYSKDILPLASNAYDIGSAALPFRDLYVGSNSIYMAGTKMFSTSNNQLVVGLPMASASGGTYLIPSYAEGWTTNGTLTLTNQATYYAWATWTPGEYSSDIGWTNNGVYIKEASAAGLYQITGNLSVSQNQNTEPLEAEVYYGPVGSPTNHHEKLSGHAYMAVSGQIYSIPVGGFLRLNVGEYCELRFANATGAGRIVSAVGGVINFRMLKIAN